MKSEFPADKQFLITQMVPCPKRLADMNNEAGGIGEVDVVDGWTTLENAPGEKKEGVEENEEMFDLDMATATVVEPAQKQDEEEEEIIDIDAEMENEDAGDSNNIFASGNYVAVDIDAEEEKKTEGSGVV
jgi:hypothetical protein